MTLLDPERLALILLPLALGGAYLVLQRRRTQYALRFSSLDLFEGVAPNRPGWRRHVAAAAYLAALLLLIVGMTRPVLAMQVPATPTVVLAIDVSESMIATDISPNRLSAAEAAANRFLEDVPAGTRIGLVAFSGSAHVLVTPTPNLDTVRSAIGRLQLGEGTAIGEAIFTSLDLLPRITDVTQVGTPGSSAAPTGTTGTTNQTTASNQRSGAIVLLSDGGTNAGRPNAQASAEAVAEGVTVSTIAFGTSSGTVTLMGRTIPVPVDGPALQTIATTTGGQFFTAASADQVQSAYEQIAKTVGTTTEDREVTDYLVGAALFAAVVAAGASLAWFSRLP
jgi:Ca-activated chloride channel family protein